jgi:hypothetical protein
MINLHFRDLFMEAVKMQKSAVMHKCRKVIFVDDWKEILQYGIASHLFIRSILLKFNLIKATANEKGRSLGLEKLEHE